MALAALAPIAAEVLPIIAAQAAPFLAEKALPYIGKEGGKLIKKIGKSLYARKSVPDILNQVQLDAQKKKGIEEEDKYIGPNLMNPLDNLNPNPNIDPQDLQFQEQALERTGLSDAEKEAIIDRYYSDRKKKNEKKRRKYDNSEFFDRILQEAQTYKGRGRLLKELEGHSIGAQNLVRSGAHLARHLGASKKTLDTLENVHRGLGGLQSVIGKLGHVNKRYRRKE